MSPESGQICENPAMKLGRRKRLFERRPEHRAPDRLTQVLADHQPVVSDGFEIVGMLSDRTIEDATQVQRRSHSTQEWV